MEKFNENYIRGLSDTLGKITLSERTKLFNGTATGCLKSTGVLDKFKSCYNTSSSVEDFLAKLSQIPDVETRVITPQYKFEISYAKCFCPLVQAGIIVDKIHCECSFQSMLIKLEAVLGKGNVAIEMPQTCLRGDKNCVFQFKVKNLKTDDNTFLLHYEKPFAYDEILAFLRFRAIKNVEIIDETTYKRTFRYNGSQGEFIVENCPEFSALKLTIHCENSDCFADICTKVRKFFDLDQEHENIYNALKNDRLLFPNDNKIIPRLPSAFDPFEFIVRAILGQQITVKAATTLAGRIVERANIQHQDGMLFFPTAEEFLALDLSNIGIVQKRIDTLKIIAKKITDKELDFELDFDDFRAQLLPIKGIGEWTVNYVAMRALGMTDCFPVDDLGVIKAMSANGIRMNKKEMIKIAESWRPYRSYATLLLWRNMTNE